MRGTPDVTRGGIVQLGIIPADAGNTEWVTGWRETEEDHPRGCGEHCPSLDYSLSAKGSSPRMRGTHRQFSKWLYINGIIPADAGNTDGTRAPSQACEDHPRGCGEHSLASSLANLKMGSSPRMRGTRTGYQPGDQFLGIIPADAGNTLYILDNNSKDRDHPRGCGEHDSSSGMA